MYDLSIIYIYGSEVRVHLLTALGVGNNIH